MICLDASNASIYFALTCVISNNGWLSPDLSWKLWAGDFVASAKLEIV